VKTFEEFLAEGRDAPLFHGTSTLKAESILKSNILKANKDWGNDKPHVSFTRTMSIAAEWAGYRGNLSDVVVFEFDQSKLIHRYSLFPINYGNGSKTRYVAKPFIKSPDYVSSGSFREERSPVSIVDMDKYLVKIHVWKLPKTIPLLAKHPKLFFKGKFVNQ